MSASAESPNPPAGKPAKDIPGIVAPPPLVFLAGLILGYGLERVWTLPAPRVPELGIALVVCGIALMGWGIATFKKIGTDYKPYRPSTRLITSGPFRFTRNPLYLSMCLIYLGIALRMGSYWPYLLLVPVLLVMQYGVVLREEAYLERKFGEDYRRLKQTVPRWIGLPKV
jgi:protein-S-isoprenylcysteine O-methyltransferase Ste14